jgi:hypothetical protein
MTTKTKAKLTVKFRKDLGTDPQIYDLKLNGKTLMAYLCVSDDKLLLSDYKKNGYYKKDRVIGGTTLAA